MGTTSVVGFPTHEARFRLDRRVVFVSGAAGHLGRAMSIGMAQAGAHVILNGRTEATLQGFADELAEQGLSASTAVFDISDRAAADAFLAGLERLDVLVNNAIPGLGSIRTATPQDFRAMAETGLIACHENVIAALPALEAAVVATGHASVINIASLWAHVTPPMHLFEPGDPLSPPQYGAAKGGLLQLTRYLACQLAGKRIRVNSLSPGVFPPDDIVALELPIIDRLSARAPLARLGSASELTGPAVFLASDAASYITGADLKVDGGWTAW